jgi:RND family efflux transporter MFP subunit
VALNYFMQRISQDIPMQRFMLVPFLLLVLAACGDDKQSAAPAGPAVTVSQPVQKEIVEWDEYTGRFGAVDSVEVRARVNGYLNSVNFKAGQTVKKGDLLFVIDPRPFRIALDQAEAQLVQAKTAAALAAKDLGRAATLLQSKNVSEQFYDQRQQSKQAADAGLKAAQANVDNARLNVEFTEVRAPVAGRVSREMVSPGNLVSGGGTGSTLLTTIVSLDPIYFYFDADEAEYLKYQRLAKAGTRPSSRDVANPVELQLADEHDWPHKGKMDFVDNQFDANTGTMRARAIFENPEGMLSPGLFARVRLAGSGKYVAMLLPDEAIGTDQTQRLVSVIGADNKVILRPVKLGPVVEGLRVIREGIAPEDWIVIKGVQRARGGTTVNPERKSLPGSLAAMEANAVPPPPAGDGRAAKPQ